MQDNRLQPTLSDVFESREDTVSRRLAVSLPGIVESYDAGTRTASVKPSVRRLVPSAADPEEDVPEELPVIQHVPVCWPCGTNFAILGELSPGDPVLLVCQDRDISGWRKTGALSNPNDTRMHSWASAVAIPGLRADAGVLPTVPGDAAALASSVLQELQALRTSLDDLVLKFNTHVHTVAGVAPGGSTLPSVPTVTLATPPSVVGQVASAILKLGG